MNLLTHILDFGIRLVNIVRGTPDPLPEPPVPPKHMLDFLIRLNKEVLGGLFSIEHSNLKRGDKPVKASNSELRRWFKNSAVHVNGKAVQWNDPVPDEWLSLILFPKSKERKITLW